MVGLLVNNGRRRVKTVEFVIGKACQMGTVFLQLNILMAHTFMEIIQLNRFVHACGNKILARNIKVKTGDGGVLVEQKALCWLERTKHINIKR